MEARARNIRAALIATAAYAVFVVSDVLVKLLSQSLPVIQVTFMVTGVALILLLGHAGVTRQMHRIVPRYPVFATIRALLLAGDTVLIYYAFATLPLAEVYVLAFLTPIVVAASAFLFLREKLSPIATIGVFLGFAGVLVTLRPGVAPISLGHIAAIASVGMYAASLLMIRMAKPDEADIALVATNFFLLTLLAFLAALIMAQLQPVTLLQVFYAALDGTCIFAGAMWLVKAFRMGNASLVAPFQYTQIIWGSLLGLLLFAEPVELHSMTGAAIIILSGWLVLK
jgi:S-adenosylmethionine uptake transporter